MQIKCMNNIREMINKIVQIRDSIVVSIPACHAGNPGSNPGRGVFYFKKNNNILNILTLKDR